MGVSKRNVWIHNLINSVAVNYGIALSGISQLLYTLSLKLLERVNIVFYFNKDVSPPKRAIIFTIACIKSNMKTEFLPRDLTYVGITPPYQFFLVARTHAYLKNPWVTVGFDPVLVIFTGTLKSSLSYGSDGVNKSFIIA